MLVETPIKTFRVETSSQSETLQWHHELTEAIGKARASANLASDYESTLAFSPVWVEDTPECNDCNRSFSMIVRRHHCRNCGKCVCGSCCFEKVRMEDVDGGKKLQKVCNACAMTYKEKRGNANTGGGYGAAAVF
jgi:hypothetical protein